MKNLLFCALRSLHREVDSIKGGTDYHSSKSAPPTTLGHQPLPGVDSVQGSLSSGEEFDQVMLAQAW